MPDASSPPTLRNQWLHASGGLTWHLRAMRYRDSLWLNFRQTVRTWLHDWQPPTDKLLIVGPSAGHTLDEEFLRRWRKITILEPDPLARWLLRRRYPDINWCSDNIDLLSHDDTGFPRLAHYPDHALLFTNVLGQMAPRDDELARQWFTALRKRLHGHPWASYHDVISTQRAPDRLTSTTLSSASVEELANHFWQGGELEIVDHCSFGLGRSGAHQGAYCTWALRPRHFHLVEWLVEPASPLPGDADQARAVTPAGNEDGMGA